MLGALGLYVACVLLLGFSGAIAQCIYPLGWEYLDEGVLPPELISMLYTILIWCGAIWTVGFGG